MKGSKIVVFCFLCFLSEVGFPQTTKPDWELATAKENIKISYRDVNDNRNGEAREMKMVFFIDADIASIVKQFKTPEKLKYWFVPISECDIQLVSKYQWKTYMVLSLPWPFKSKDLITKNELIEKSGFSVIKMNSIPQARPIFENLKRVNSYQATWKLIPLNKTKTKVIYKTITYDEPMLPHFIADPIIQKTLMESVERLKTQVL